MAPLKPKDTVYFKKKPHTKGVIVQAEENTGSSPKELKICDQQALPLQPVYYYWPPLSGRTSAI
jgi:hypothetical protein